MDGIKVLVGPRQTFKTTNLILRAAEVGGTVLCRRVADAERVLRRAEEMGAEIRGACSAHGSNLVDLEGPVCIDSADWILADKLGICQHRIAGVVMDGVVGKVWSERQDIQQWEEFKNHRPGLSYRDFCDFKYGAGEVDECST